MRLGKSALLFVAIGLVLYAGLYYAAEQLLYRTGKSNPFYKIVTAERTKFDWLILGASHAMPLDFADFNAEMEQNTGLRIINLAAQGAGPLYNRLVFEHFVEGHRARGLLYVADSFGFYSRAWNEERLRDAGLLRRTPFDRMLAARLFDYVRHGNAPWRAFLDYATGFSKINNRDRFVPDVWEGEKQFERVFRPSTTAARRRIEYLYPDGTSSERRVRYLAELAAIIDLAKAQDMRVLVLKPPLPRQFRGMLPDEAAFDEALKRLLAGRDATVQDFSQMLDEPKFYFDTDHLNRAGLSEFFLKYLRPLLTNSGGDGAPGAADSRPGFICALEVKSC